MSNFIDPFIDLHFKDQVEVLGPEDEQLIVTLSPDASEDALEGLQIQARTADGIFAVNGGAEAREALMNNPAVECVASATRGGTVAVLVRVRHAVWTTEVPGFVRNSQLGHVVTGMATSEAISVLARDPNVLSVEASRSGGDQWDCMHSVPLVGAAMVNGPPVDERGSEALIGIIDTGIDLWHAAFADPGVEPPSTRIVAYWDQNASGGMTPYAASQAGLTGGAGYTQDYGRYYSQAEINSYLSQAAPSAVLKDPRRDPEGHGTHVAAIAAGSRYTSADSPFIPQSRNYVTGTTPFVQIPGGWSIPDGVVFPGGVAPEAGLILVVPQTFMKKAAWDPDSLGYSVSHVDALTFIKEAARAAGKPVVVNASLGMNAGAHDGTSLLELAFDEFSGGGREPGHVVVKSAGNEHAFGGHAEAVAIPGQTVSIGWDTKSIPRLQDSFEFWFASADDLEFTLIGPSGHVLATVDRQTREAQGLLPNDQGSCYLVLERFHHDNGDARLIVLVRQNNNTSLNVEGSWRLDIRGISLAADGVVHGWVERHNKRPVAFTRGRVAAQTLSIPGTARTVICVGACDLATPPVVQSFSSQGPCRDARRKPEVSAPGHCILAACAGTTHGLLPMPGTSMAAPHVTGAVALLLSRRRKQMLAENPSVPERKKMRQLNAAQIRAAVSQSAAGFNGSWNAGLGYGRLDVQRLIQAFDQA